MNTSNRVFNKPSLSVEDQVDLLEKRGLQIDDKKRAVFFLHRVNYFRLQGYFYHFQDAKDIFVSGTTFSDIEKIYIFDQKLRILLFEAIERIETFFCTTINETMLDITSDPYWYTKEQYFPKSKEFAYHSFYTLVYNKTYKKYKQNNNNLPLFIDSFYKKYTAPQTPPIWMVLEVLEFGPLLHLFLIVKQKYQRRISKKFDLKHEELRNILQITRYLRNASAHHSRIWNKRIPYSFTSSSQLSKNIISKNSYQTGIKSLMFLFSKIGFDSSLISRVISLFEEYNSVIIDKEGTVDYLKTIV